DTPLRPWEFKEKEGDDGKWTSWNFEPFAQFDLRVPEFTYSKDRWFASGGFDRIGDVKIPLSPIKKLFKESPIAKVLPDTLPLSPLNLADDDSYEQLEPLIGVLPSEEMKGTLTKVLDQIRKAIGILPSNLQEYLTIEVPESAIFEMGMDVKGGMSLGVRTLPREGVSNPKDHQPLRLLLPIMSSIPELIGFTVNSLAIGQKNAGAMFTIEMDGYVDRFNLLQLSGALAQSIINNERKDISNRYYFAETLVVMPSTLPLPMPIFTDGLRLEYEGAFGTKMQAAWRFPNPEWSILDYISIFSSLLTFFQDKEALLHKDAVLMDALRIELAYGPNFIQLPPYLGGAVLGMKNTTGPIPLDQGVARIFDFFKTGNLNYLITATPIASRVGSEIVSIGPVEMNAAWCITSEEEFNQLALETHHLDSSVLQAIPLEQDGESFEKGFVTLLSGGWNIEGISAFQVSLGMALTQDAGFQTGFLMQSSAANIALELGGRLQFGSLPKSGEIAGNCSLAVKDQTIIDTSGAIKWHPDAFEIEVSLATPKSGFKLEQGSLIISKKMIEVLGSCLVHDLSANFRLQIREKLNTILYLRDLENLQGNFSIDLKVLVRKIKQEIQDAIAQLKDAGEQQISLKSTLE
ncbi:MAG: hypothetical protein AAF599_15150, partial [Bacteroidota bacterium]